MTPPAKKATKKAAKKAASGRFRANRIVSLKDSGGAEAHFQKGEEVTLPIPDPALAKYLSRGDIEEMT